jgi:hypothetical protein
MYFLNCQEKKSLSVLKNIAKQIFIQRWKMNVKLTDIFHLCSIRFRNSQGLL